MNPNDRPHGRIAVQFASALIAGRYDEACALLTAAARDTWPPSVLQKAYEDMVSYFETPPHTAQAIEVMTDWPDRRPDDIGWAYASIEGDGEAEAVTVIVAMDEGASRIREIEWGRP